MKDWKPTAKLEALRLRAELYAMIRRFFAERGVLEVETPILSAAGNTEPNIESFRLRFDGPRGAGAPERWLRTSPEFPLKRLLAAGIGDCYELGRVFRNGEAGKRHNPEFTMLEWYRVGDGYQQGMNLLAELVEEVIRRWSEEFPASSPRPALVRCVTYRTLFLSATGLDPHLAPTAELVEWARRQSLPPPDLDPADRDSWLDWIGSQFAEPSIDRETPTLVYDFPASKAALAQVVRVGEATVAQRFELYYRGFELANGYYELLSPDVLRDRSIRANRERIQDGKQPLPEESRLEEAMRVGMPPCSGTALGVDRLLMALIDRTDISGVLSFPVDRS